MAERPIVLALANPGPEIDANAAAEAGAAVVASGRSDYPNQVHNVLAFPACSAMPSDVQLTDDDAAARGAAALTDLVADPGPERILPGVLDDRIVPAIAGAVAGGT